MALATAAAAQDFQRVAPQTLPAKPLANIPALSQPVPKDEPTPQTVVIKSLKGIRFVASVGTFQKDGNPTEGVDASAIPLLSDDAFRGQMNAYLGKPLTVGDLTQIRQQTILWLRDHDRPLSDVVIPPQVLKGDTVQIVAVEFVAAKVGISGNKYFSTDVLNQEVTVNPGDVIAGTAVLGDLDALNSNTFRSAKVTYSKSDTVGATDIDYEVTDHDPWRVFTGYQNNGTQSTDRNRYLIGGEWGNVFGWNDDLSYQFTASPEIKEFWSHSFVFTAPVNGHDSLTIMGSYANTVPQLSNAFGQTAVSYQLSGRYNIPLYFFSGIRQHVGFGFDFKHSDSNLTYTGISVLTSATDIDQFVLSYDATRPDSLGETGLTASLFLSPGHLSSGNTDAAFRPSATTSGTPFADANYVYGTIELNRTTHLPEDFTLASRFVGQASSTSLLASEQLGLGGATSVRGYEERAVNADGGILFSNEVRAPAFAVIDKIANTQWDDKLQLLAFWDYGIGVLDNPTAGEKRATYLSSPGLGMRYSIAQHLEVAADWGQPLIRVPVYGRKSRIDISVSLSY